jgi:hypothetical protein
MARKGKKETTSPPELSTKHDSSTKESKKEILEGKENAFVGDGTIEAKERTQPLRELVGDRVNVLSADFFAKSKFDIIKSYFELSR